MSASTSCCFAARLTHPPANKAVLLTLFHFLHLKSHDPAIMRLRFTKIPARWLFPPKRRVPQVATILMILRLVVIQVWEPTRAPAKLKAKARQRKQLILSNRRALPEKSLGRKRRKSRWCLVDRNTNQPGLGNPASLKIQSRTRTTTAKRDPRV